jgi:hypothetical protein
MSQDTCLKMYIWCEKVIERTDSLQRIDAVNLPIGLFLRVQQILQGSCYYHVYLDRLSTYIRSLLGLLLY